MKIVLNRCYGGFSLSVDAVKLYAELQGREAHFFTQKYPSKKWEKLTLKEARKDFCPYAFDTLDIPKEDSMRYDMAWYNDWWSKHQIDNRPDNRADPLLIQVVEKLGKKADGKLAQLEIVEIPDGVDWEIDEYDGIEHAAEKHRTW